MDFENMNISLSEFFEILNKKRIEMASSGKFSEDEIKEWEDNFFALQFQTKNYLRQHEQYPDLFPEYLNEDAWIPGETIYPAFKELYDYLCGREIGEIALDKVSMLTVTALTRIAVQAAKDAGFDSHREQLVKAVGDTIENITVIAANDKTDDYEDKETGLVKSGEILKRYPDTIKLMKDRVTQKVFKNETNKGEVTSYSFMMNERETVEGMILLTVAEQFRNDNRYDGNVVFSYYDWAVMEAVTTLYMYAIGRDEAGKDSRVVIDLKSIDKILKHNKLSRTANADAEKIKETALYDSLRKLRSIQVNIYEGNHEFGGCILDGDFAKSEEGKLCFVLNRRPVLYDYADTVGRNHILEVELDSLYATPGHKDNYKFRYTEEKISIYRYLIERVIEIFGTLKTDDVIKDKKHLHPEKTNSIPFTNIFKAIYPDGFSEYEDPERKKRALRESVEDVLNMMKAKGFFTGYRIKSNGNSETIMLLRE